MRQSTAVAQFFSPISDLDRNNLGSWMIRVSFVFFSLFILLLIVFSGSDSKEIPDATDKGFGLKDRDVLLYLEAISRIQQDALFLSPTATRERVVQDTLKAYLEQHDSSSEYLTPEEYLAFKESQNEKYVGIGLALEKNRSGDIVCYPYPGSAADKAGVSVGDRIIRIDGIPVKGRSLFSVASLARGKTGTKVSLALLTGAGLEKQVSVTRSEAKVENVSKQFFGTIPIIKVISFSGNSRGELKYILNDWEKSKPIIIDLRGNGGGDLHAAIDSAMLFLQEGKNIVSIKTRNGSKSYASNDRALNLLSPIYLWQDEATASAAEVFIAALTQGRRAVSIGKRTFGKGTKQDIIELSDGSALVLTTGYLLTPDGTDFREHGLNPTYTLKETPPATEDFVAKVEQLIGSKWNRDKGLPNSSN